MVLEESSDQDDEANSGIESDTMKKKNSSQKVHWLSGNEK